MGEKENYASRLHAPQMQTMAGPAPAHLAGLHGFTWPGASSAGEPHCGSESLFGETPVVPTPSFPLGGGGHGSGEDVGGAGTEVQVGSADHSRSRRAQAVHEV